MVEISDEDHFGRVLSILLFRGHDNNQSNWNEVYVYCINQGDFVSCCIRMQSNGSLVKVL